MDWEESREGKSTVNEIHHYQEAFCFWHSLVVNKYSQTCRWTFLKGVLAIRSVFPASLAACRIRGGCFLRNSPRHSCGGTEMQRVLPAAFHISASPCQPAICTKWKGLSDRWHIHQQAEPNLSSVAVHGTPAFKGQNVKCFPTFNNLEKKKMMYIYIYNYI